MTATYSPRYEKSWALVIGINDYQHVQPLDYARHDAEAIADLLTSRFAFPPEQVTLLIDGTATRQGILESYLRFTTSDVTADDRIVVFFAGHGHTQTGKRGEVGYLVPVDGIPDNLATLIRWDELTRNSELIPAKHILFIMDACYGGLALTRAPAAGSMRFLKDMLHRYARQVLTAGKADEVVADANGPLPHHSIFTGHLLQALDGVAATTDGIMSGNTVMAYVYDRVAKDQYSHQTPHYGYLDGDGDFIFNVPVLDESESFTTIDSDTLIEIPLSNLPHEETADLIQTVKEYIPDRRSQIALDDIVTKQIRHVISSASVDHFPNNNPYPSSDSIIERLAQYEALTSDLRKMYTLLGYWSSGSQQKLLSKVLQRIADNADVNNGMAVWLALRWYPCALLLYTGGVASIAAERYDNLATMLMTPVGDKYSGGSSKPVLTRIVDEMLSLDQADVFKRMPGHERLYVPRSEYLFKTLQPQIEDILFLGRSYEDAFDRFEMLYCLAYMDMDTSRRGAKWGPPGRFVWKHKRLEPQASPLSRVLGEARAEGPDWPPVKAGLFGRSVERFETVAQEYLQVLEQLPWY